MTWEDSSFRRRGYRGPWRANRSRGARIGTGSQPSSPPPPLGELIDTISPKDADPELPGGEGHCGISNVELVASYNWMEGPHAKIVVPGRPPLWTPPTGPQKMRRDSGVFYRDRNAAYYPSHPLEPAVMSVMRMHPEPLLVDLVACASTIGNLLRYVRGDARSFRMLIEVVGHTVHLVRRENSPKEQHLNIMGYRHNFLDAFTNWEPGFGRSVSHQRIVTYCLGGLQVLLRFEVDAYLGAGEQPRATATGVEAESLSLVRDLRLRRDDAATDLDEDGLEVTSAGAPTPQNSILDVKTRSTASQHNDILGEQMLRLWVRQMPKSILAYHKQGLFEDAQVQDTGNAVAQWIADNQSELRQLVGLLRRLARDALANKGPELELVKEGRDELELRRRLPDAGTVLSQSVRAQWEGWLGQGRKKNGLERAPSAVNKPVDHEAYDEGADALTACDRECGYCGKCLY